jgi:NAD(P)-dependent dehydrogenase (short-subunit alcohol dehydrogenase family)
MPRTYAVTGASSGIGASTAALLSARGHRVIGVDIADCEVTADLSLAWHRRAAARTVRALADGRLDGVIAAAGIAAGEPKTVAVNFFGVTEFVSALTVDLAHSPAPRVAVLSSVASLQYAPDDLVAAMLDGDEERALALGAALTEQGPGPGYLNYSASKRALSRWVRREAITERFAGRGIALNAVAPGTVETPLTAPLLATEEGRAMVDAAVPMPLGGHARAEDVARLLMWLTSEENTHVTGQTIYLDGGADAVLRGDDIWS